jgi:hypothetical protein
MITINHMKRILTIAIVLFLTIHVKAQILTPVKWSYAAKKTGKDEAVVFIKATIDKGWHIYSQNVKDGGPVRTTFTFLPASAYTLIGYTIEPIPVIMMQRVI